MAAVHPAQVPKKWHPGKDQPPDYGPPPNLVELEEEPPHSFTEIPRPPVSGYEGVSFSQEKLAPPPPAAPSKPVGDKPPRVFADVPQLDEEDCRAALFNFVSEHCCYGTKAAKEMNILTFQAATAIHYILETFTERRDSRNVAVPYMGGPVDGPENGIPPLPWNIPCQPSVKFEKHDVKIEVPHTSVVLKCCECDGLGWNWCWRCGGKGTFRCTSCSGKGFNKVYDSRSKTVVRKYCRLCGGDGKRRCVMCSGDGRITCRTCQGYCQLRCYILLTVSYTNNKEDFILETTDMPDELVREVDGKIVFQDVEPLIEPLVKYPVKEINEQSQEMVSSHRTKWPTERILIQRQTVRGVPVTEVVYKWRNTQSRYWVYGNEKKVYAPDYPQKCCWGCEIQ